MSGEHEYVLWALVFAFTIHVLEEEMLGWLRWSNEVIGPRFGIHLTPADFYTTNAAGLVAAIAAAVIGWRAPELSLTIPPLFVVNAVFFHILPSLVQRRFSPGLITAVVLYLPATAWAYWAAAEDDVLDAGVLVISVLGGVLLMAAPIAFARLRARLV